MYVQVYKRERDGSETPVRAIPLHQAVGAINGMSGRDVGRYIIDKAIPHSMSRRAYVAAAQGSPWRQEHGTSGFIVQLSDGEVPA